MPDGIPCSLGMVWPTDFGHESLHEASVPGPEGMLAIEGEWSYCSWLPHHKHGTLSTGAEDVLTLVLK